MRDVHDGMRGKGERQNCQGLVRVANERRRGHNQKAQRQRDVEPYTELPVVIDRGANVRAGRQCEQECGKLRQPQFRHQSIR